MVKIQIEFLITSLSCTRVLFEICQSSFHHKDSCYLEFISDNIKLNANCENLMFSNSLASDSDLNSGTSLRSIKYKVLTSHNP